MGTSNEIQKRETNRRRALWRLARLAPGNHAALDIIQTLNEIEQAELNDASLVKNTANVAEVLNQVQAEDYAQGISIVRVENIPQPWRARFVAASIGSTRLEAGFYELDWLSFLKKWQAEMTHLERHRVAVTSSVP